ncbi:hypothetical protein AAMO2058_000935000 [Amorphochlora amoebiformis]|eukprot:1377648-Amorphochlora_amoeboformis.AAC.1
MGVVLLALFATVCAMRAQDGSHAAQSGPELRFKEKSHSAARRLGLGSRLQQLTEQVNVQITQSESLRARLDESLLKLQKSSTGSLGTDAMVEEKPSTPVDEQAGVIAPNVTSQKTVSEADSAADHLENEVAVLEAALPPL